MQYQFFLAMDLTSYGSALAILNQFADDEVVKVFEISPVGQAAFLILTTKNLVDAEILKNQIAKIYKDDVLSLELIKNIPNDVLKAYLSQNTPQLKKAIAVLESDRISKAFHVASEIFSENVSILDFRVVRTQPCNVILIFTSDSLSELLEIKNKFGYAKTTIISEPQKTLKSYFEVLK